MKNERLVQARRERGLTQEQLAKLLKYSGKSAVANWENGHAKPSLPIALEIARILNSTVDYLFGYQVQENYTNQDADEKPA